MMENSPRVMVLDSDVKALPRLYRLLAGQGIPVATYSSPWPACRYAETEKPDAILTSIGFPGCEGAEIVRLLRAASPGSQIIVLAAEEEWPRLASAGSARADAVLGKPHQDEAVLQLVRRSLEARLVDATP